ncbi:MAG: hypothetical protein N2691_04160 [Patescibacteria group bacterium]|nr:hypothetical protein [Patescibacteria group bacterium]
MEPYQIFRFACIAGLGVLAFVIGYKRWPAEMNAKNRKERTRVRLYLIGIYAMMLAVYFVFEHIAAQLFF